MIEQLGRYQVRDRIGQGAMADVYRAYDPSIDRVLAVKVLRGELRKDPEYVARFLREARAAGALSHPSIVTVYDVGEAGGYPYIAMELLDGEPLDAVLKARGALPLEEVLAVGIQLADALAYAHAAGIVHRDIKPSNIVLGRAGQPLKILDFGIARIVETDHEADSLKTQVGQVMGTPRYMSPEQVLGEPIDGRTDLFSVGLVLYEMLSGQRAFAGANPATLALQIVAHDPRPIAELVAQTPAGLQAILGKLLAKKRDRRFADGGELAEALRREQAALATVAAETHARRRMPMPVRLTLAMTLITAAALALSSWGVLRGQYRAMEQMALSSGAAMTNFVASNAAMSTAENAGLAPDQQDWAPVAAFVGSAARDPNVRRLAVVDASGVVRASTDAALVGRRYAAPTGEPVLRKVGEVTAIDEGDKGFRFVRPINYAGRTFGQVDVSFDKTELSAAAGRAFWLMVGLVLVILGVVAAVAYAGARFMTQPIQRLKSAFNDAARTGGAARISHDRSDEFGQVFDSFNRFVAAAQERVEAAEEAARAAPAKASGPSKPALPAAFAPDATVIAQRVDAALDKVAPDDGTVIRAPARKRPKTQA